MQIASQEHILVVGGGIAGLSAAWELEQAGIAYTLVEASERWGGKIRTDIVETELGNFLVEAGPDSFISQKPWASILARELGLGAKLLGTNDDERETFIYQKGKLQALPDGVMLIVPTKFLPFALSPLFSPFAKLRMAVESLIPPKQDDADESLAAFIRRRLGNEALDKLAEPLMAGIYNTDAEQQSILATFPRFRELEKQYGSLSRGMLASRKQQPASKSSMFTSFVGGMRVLVDELVKRLSGELLLNTKLEKLEADGVAYQAALSGGRKLRVSGVILAIPSFAVLSLLQNLLPEAITALESIRYLSTGTVSLAYRKEDMPCPLKGFGLVIPRSEKRPINAITVSSTKFKHRAPENMVLLRVFFGGSRSPQSMNLADEDLLERVQAEIQALTGTSAQPLFSRIYRNWKANPQYETGHLERLSALEATLPSNIILAGSAYRGVGVPDCVQQGREAAKKLVSVVHSIS